MRLPDHMINEWVDLIIRNSELTEIKDILDVVQDDPSDNKFLETALNGKADYIITRDNHLLKIKEYKGIRIITPEEFLKELK
ncbi:MAG: putative toxin-antitoxin system toxin component, PIN family [Candidatus Woesearchaeota archaeon]